MGRKVVPIALTARGDDRNWNLSDEEFTTIGEQGQVKLTTAARNKIRRILLGHLSIANRVASALPVHEVTKTLKAIQRQATALSGTLERLYSPLDPLPQYVRTSLATADFSYNSLNELKALLVQLESAIPAALKLPENMPYVNTPNGRLLRPHLQELIWELAAVFEKSGKRATAGYSPNARMPDGSTGGRNTAFIRFVFSIMAYLPTDNRVKFSALGDVIHRALKARPTPLK